MNKKYLNKIVAFATAASLMLGNSAIALAADADGATGTGTSTGHLNEDVVSAVLPTTESVNGLFNYTIDPEGILAKADKFTDNSTAAGEGATNEDGVYFKQADGAAKAYASTSQAVSVKGKNYVAADVSATVTVGAAAEGKTLIPLAESSAALTAATVPTLLLTLQVGGETGVVTSNGVTVSDELAAQASKFDVKWNDTSKKYEITEKAAQTWDGVDVKLSGKIKGGTVTDDLQAPTVNITWTVTKHVDAPAVTLSNATASSTAGVNFETTFTKGTAKTLTFTGLAQGETLSTAKWGNAKDSITTAAANITLSGAAFTIGASNWGGAANGDKKYVKITTSAGTDYIIEVTVATA